MKKRKEKPELDWYLSILIDFKYPLDFNDNYNRQ
jgi:hypothetical protein